MSMLTTHHHSVSTCLGILVFIALCQHHIFAQLPSSCNFKQDVDFNGNDITYFPANSSAACCNACTSASTCLFWSFNGPKSASGNLNCYLKTSNSGKAPSPGVISGQSSGPLPRPSPAPSPGESTHNLYICINVVLKEDVTLPEQTELIGFSFCVAKFAK